MEADELLKMANAEFESRLPLVTAEHWGSAGDDAPLQMKYLDLMGRRP